MENSSKFVSKIIFEALKTNKSNLNEDWKKNVIAAAFALSSVLGGKASSNFKDSTSKQEISFNKSDSLKIPIGTLFQSGKYTFQNTDENQIYDKLKEIGEFIKAHENSQFAIDIVSSESQVPNKDAENVTKDKAGNPIYKRLDKGVLAQKRAETAKFMISTFLSQLDKNHLIQGDVHINDPKILIGNTPYTQGDDPKDSKFTNEQYVNIIIHIVGNTKNIKYNSNKDTSDNKTHIGPISSYVINIRGDESGNKGIYYFPENEEDFNKVRKDITPNSSSLYKNYGQATYDMNLNVFNKRISNDAKQNLGRPWRRIKKGSDDSKDVYQQL